MPRMKFQTLTEQMFYILSLREECYGMDIMEKVNEITNGRVNVSPGTLYNLLEQFVDAEMIRETKVEGRKRCYILTEKGKNTLQGEVERLRRQIADFSQNFGEE